MKTTELRRCIEAQRSLDSIFGKSELFDADAMEAELVAIEKAIAVNGIESEKIADEKLNIKVWELLGWRNVGIINDVECWQKSESGGEGAVSWSNIASSKTTDIPDFCNDDAAALGLVKRIAEKGKSILVRFDAYRDNNEWTVWLEPSYRKDMPLSDVGREIVLAFIHEMEAVEE